jgi:tape measure domain-containing protein
MNEPQATEEDRANALKIASTLQEIFDLSGTSIEGQEQVCAAIKATCISGDLTPLRWNIICRRSPDLATLIADNMGISVVEVFRATKDGRVDDYSHHSRLGLQIGDKGRAVKVDLGRLTSPESNLKEDDEFILDWSPETYFGLDNHSMKLFRKQYDHACDGGLVAEITGSPLGNGLEEMVDFEPHGPLGSVALTLPRPFAEFSDTMLEDISATFTVSGAIPPEMNGEYTLERAVEMEKPKDESEQAKEIYGVRDAPKMCKICHNVISPNLLGPDEPDMCHAYGCPLSPYAVTPEYTLEQAKVIMEGNQAFHDIEYLGDEMLTLDGGFTTDQLRLIIWIKENKPYWMNEI